MELVQRDGGSLGKTLVVAARRVAANPLIWGIGGGLICNSAAYPAARSRQRRSS